MTSEFCIREVNGDKAATIYPMVKDLYAHLGMPPPELAEAELAKDLRKGTVRALLVYADEKDERVAAYVLYYVLAKSEFGQILLLEDIFIREQFRRMGLGGRIFGELAKIAKANSCAFVEWYVLRSNTRAIAFYDQLANVEDVTGSSKASFWWQFKAAGNFNGIGEKTQRKNVKVSKTVVLMDEAMSEQQSSALAMDWLSLLFESDELERAQLEGRERLTGLFRIGALGAVFVEQFETGATIGMALFSRNGYSSWLGQSMLLDQMFVQPDHRRRGIGTLILAELARVAQCEQIKHICWTAPSSAESDAFFSSLKADKLEHYIIYRWHCAKIHFDSEICSQKLLNC